MFQSLQKKTFHFIVDTSRESCNDWRQFGSFDQKDVDKKEKYWRIWNLHVQLRPSDTHREYSLEELRDASGGFYFNHCIHRCSADILHLKEPPSNDLDSVLTDIVLDYLNQKTLYFGVDPKRGVQYYPTYDDYNSSMSDRSYVYTIFI